MNKKILLLALLSGLVIICLLAIPKQSRPQLVPGGVALSADAPADFFLGNKKLGSDSVMIEWQEVMQACEPGTDLFGEPGRPFPPINTVLADGTEILHLEKNAEAVLDNGLIVGQEAWLRLPSGEIDLIQFFQCRIDERGRGERQCTIPIRVRSTTPTGRFLRLQGQTAAAAESGDQSLLPTVRWHFVPSDAPAQIGDASTLPIWIPEV